MIFSDPPFWLFFAIVFGLYVVLPHRLQNRLLLIASYFFYGCWDWRFLSLILFSTTVDYYLGRRMEATVGEAARRRLILVSVVLNLTLLGVFKYLGFFVESFSALLARFDIVADPTTLNIILPVGISFYTFQSLSYTIDVYRRDLKATPRLQDFALYVAFFPQLVAGPIERAKTLLPYITAPRVMTADLFGRGVVLCLLGLIKKVVIADNLGPIVNGIYGSSDPTGMQIVVATWLFALQIYGDFSGYTDIARGISKMMGFDLMKNFDQPYFALSPQSFWRRWHISLSTWLRDYLYIPLGGNRYGEARTYRNLMLTMTLGGLWHGAAWNFVLWGVYQGALLAGHRKFGAAFNTPAGWPAAVRLAVSALKLAVFFQVVCYGWLLFRSQSFAQIADYTGKIMSLPSTFSLAGLPDIPLAAVVGTIFVLAWDAAVETSRNYSFYARLPTPVRAALYASMVYVLALGGVGASAEFIYFQF